MNSWEKLFLAFAIVMFFVCVADAKTRKTERSKAWKQFQTAVARNDKAAIAEMIKFPFEASIAGEELNFKVESKTNFLENYALIFNIARRKSIARGKYIPTPDEDEFGFELYENGAYHVFKFRKIGGKYLLTETMAAG